MKLKWIIGLLLFSNYVAEGYTVRVIVCGRIENRDIYIAGYFNDWNPGDVKYKLQPLSSYQKQIVLTNVLPGPFEFKFTKGDWSMVESTDIGFDIPNRKIHITRDTIIYADVPAWHDEYVILEGRADSIQYMIMMERGSYYLDRNLDSSSKYTMMAYPLAIKLDSKEKLAGSFDLLGDLYSKRGVPFESLNFFFKVLELKKQLGDSVGVANVYIKIAQVFANNEDEKKAVEYYRSSIEWVQVNHYSEEDVADMGKAYFHVAMVGLGKYYFKHNQLDSARYFAEKAIEVGGNMNGGPLLLYGDIYKKEGKISDAISAYLAVAIGINSNNNLNLVAEASQKLAEVYQKKDQLDSAYFFARRAFVSSNQTKNPYSIVSNGLFLISLFKKDNILDSAFLYQEKVILAKDSIFNREKERQIQSVYYNEKIKQREIFTEKEKYRSQLQISILVGGVIVLILLGLFYWLKLRNNFYKKMAGLEMRALRAQMNPHFIFNCLTSINRYIVKSDNKTASNYLTKFAKLIRLILDNSASEYITLDSEQQTLKLYLEMESLRFDHAFDFEILKDDNVISDTILLPSMLVQPYVENAIWHGLLHKEDKGKLWIRFEKNRASVLTVIIEDNGVGRQKAMELEKNNEFKTKSYGMQISKDRMKVISRLYKFKTTIAIEDLANETGAAGTKVILQIPLIKNKLQYT